MAEPTCNWQPNGFSRYGDEKKFFYICKLCGAEANRLVDANETQEGNCPPNVPVATCANYVPSRKRPNATVR